MTPTTEQVQASDAPTATNLADFYHLAPLDWDDVNARLTTDRTRPAGGGEVRPSTLWLSTGDADGRPHLTAVSGYWVEGCYYFCGGPRSRKIRNLERDPRCALGVAVDGYDVVLEGRAERMTDQTGLERLAGVLAEGGWAATVDQGGFTYAVNAPSAGPPPWHVYQFTPGDVYAVLTDEPGGATHWSF